MSSGCITFLWLTFFFATSAVGQDSVQFRDALAVMARPSPDSITLRWAPKTVEAWQRGNRNGYLIERFLIARNGVLITPPEKSVLRSLPYTPLPEDSWEVLVKRNRYAAIAAQALFGDRFEIDLGASDAVSIVNKIRENEQRFSFALFCAEMSPEVAHALALWFTDRTVKKGEKYLYRVAVSQSPDLTGSAFVGAEDAYPLPKPLNLAAEFTERHVSLRWEKNALTPYTAYQLERSVDGKDFSPATEEPLVTLTPPGAVESRYEYASDSLPDTQNIYHYRVRGITPFGERGEPSDVVTGKSTAVTTDVPYITAGENSQNTAIRLQWEFPTESNAAIQGFSVERGAKSAGEFQAISPGLLPPETRTYEDKHPNSVNYYRVKAHSLRGELFVSPPFLAQLVDSIPPLMPTGLMGRSDDQGAVVLSWAHNQEADLFGYRVYRANFIGEELSQITYEPLPENTHNDQVNVNNLNEAIYYSVVAVDRNQNESPFSAWLKVPLPDKIKPQPPVLLPLRSDDGGVTLSWWPSGSQDVVQYDVYRLKEKDEWQRIKIVPATRDTLYRFTDAAAEQGREHTYILEAVDDVGLESEPTQPVKIWLPRTALPESIAWADPVVDIEKKQVTLQWQSKQSGIMSFQLFRSVGEDAVLRYRSLEGTAKEWVDTALKPGVRYAYQIMVLYENGTRSSLSQKVTVEF